MAKKKTVEVLMRCKGLCDGCRTIAEMIVAAEAFAASLRAMQADGVELAREVEDDYPQLELKTSNPTLVKKYASEEIA